MIIAEIGGNHQGSLSRALELIEAAAWAGATHVKFQCFTPEQMVGDPDYVLDDGPWKGRRLLDLYQETHTPREWFPKLFEKARKLNLVPFASVFHKDDIEFLQGLDCNLYKISSFEAVDLDLIQAAADTGNQLLVSTGMLNQRELTDILEIVDVETIFMKCTSAYPADASAANLATMAEMENDGLIVGISDHTSGCGVAAAAVALGAVAVEKHLILNRNDGGPDAAFSMVPHEFKQMAEACRQARAAMGEIKYGPTDAEKPSLKLRRSLWWAADLNPGDIIAAEHIKCCRPADGLPPAEIDNVIGGVVIVPVHANTPISPTSRHYE